MIDMYTFVSIEDAQYAFVDSLVERASQIHVDVAQDWDVIDSIDDFEFIDDFSYIEDCYASAKNILAYSRS